MNAKEFRENVRIPFKNMYRNQINELGYNMSTGSGVKDGEWSIKVRIQPLGEENLDQKEMPQSIDELLPDTFMGYKVKTQYIGNVGIRKL